MENVKKIISYNGEELSLINLPMNVTGFSEFLSSWILRSGSETVLVDCGVSGSYSHLKAALDSLGAKPDLLMLTHIHLDHSGATGRLCRDFPGMKVFCFERAAKHLISPQKLWMATAATLGEDVSAAYQEPLPVPQEQIITRTELPQCWKVIDTPGHATHHVSFLRDFAGKRICFGGEALGVFAGEGVTHWFTDSRDRSGLRPATPPKYYPEIGRASMRLLANEKWDIFCAAHYGPSTDKKLPERALRQSELWEKTIIGALKDGLGEDEIVQLMLNVDPELADIAFYTPDNKEREVYFLHNSVRGFVQYLTSQK